MDKIEIEQSIVERVRAAGDRGLTYQEWALASGLDSRTAVSVWDEMIGNRGLIKLGQRRAGGWAFKLGQRRSPRPASPSPKRPRNASPHPRATHPRLSTKLEAHIRSLCLSYATALVVAIRRAPVAELGAVVRGSARRRSISR
jgi:hypothetical protein